MVAFVRRRPAYVIPQDLEMFSKEANHDVFVAIKRYADEANREAEKLGMVAFHDRLNAFQDEDVETADEGNDYDDFLGYTPPEFYDPQGNVFRV